MSGTINTDVTYKVYISIGSRDPMMSYITTWREYICTMPPGNDDETGLATAKSTLIHALDLSIIVSIDASNILKTTVLIIQVLESIQIMK